MLDGFHQHHSQLVFRDHNRVRLSEAAFQAARRAAARSLDPPDRAFLRSNGSYERHRLFYEYHLVEKMDAYSRNLPSKIDRMLVETVILQDFLRMEEASPFRESSSVGRSIAVLGWMIQERLGYIILQTGDRSYKELLRLRHAHGINTDAWGSRLVGATAQAKAIMQISRARDLRLYPATLVDDVKMGIDFLVETHNGSGACVSVKTDVGGDTRFLLESETGYEGVWSRIVRGSQAFREYTHRHWRPLLLLMGKPRGENFVFYQKNGEVSLWVTDLERILSGTYNDTLTA